MRLILEKMMRRFEKHRLKQIDLHITVESRLALAYSPLPEEAGRESVL
jgi:hypothetical protein